MNLAFEKMRSDGVDVEGMECRCLVALASLGYRSSFFCHHVSGPETTFVLSSKYIFISFFSPSSCCSSSMAISMDISACFSFFFSFGARLLSSIGPLLAESLSGTASADGTVEYASSRFSASRQRLTRVLSLSSVKLFLYRLFHFLKSILYTIIFRFYNL